MQSSNLNEVGTHTVQATVALEKYPTVRLFVTFQLTIQPCQIETFLAVDLADQVYNVFEIAKLFSLTPFKQEPACNYPVTYTFEMINPYSGMLPSWISVTNGLDFKIQTNNIADAGRYLIRVKGSVMETQGNPIPTILNKFTSFTLEVANLCFEDVITPTTYGTFAQIQYLISTTGPKMIPLAFNQKTVGCPFELDLLVVDNVTS